MHLRCQSVVRSMDVRDCSVAVGEELKPPEMRLDVKQFLQEKAINDVMSEVTEK